MATKRKLAEQALRILSGGQNTRDSQVSIQELMIFVNQAYAFVVKKNWWNNRREGESGVNGNFIYSFEDIVINKDTVKNLYYANLLSSFLGDIPHELGISHVSYVQSLNKPFVRLANGMNGLLRGLQSEGMGGNDTFFVENDKVYLPTVKKVNEDCKLLMKLVVALEGIDEETNIAIPPDIAIEIVQMTVQMYGQQQDRVKDVINDNKKN